MYFSGMRIGDHKINFGYREIELPFVTNADPKDLCHTINDEQE